MTPTNNLVELRSLATQYSASGGLNFASDVLCLCDEIESLRAQLAACEEAKKNLCAALADICNLEEDEIHLALLVANAALAALNEKA